VGPTPALVTAEWSFEGAYIVITPSYHSVSFSQLDGDQAIETMVVSDSDFGGFCHYMDGYRLNIGQFY
jgi:hypothetical protein